MIQMMSSMMSHHTGPHHPFEPHSGNFTIPPGELNDSIEMDSMITHPMDNNTANSSMDVENLMEDLCSFVQRVIEEEKLCVNSLAETCFGEPIPGLFFGLDPGAMCGFETTTTEATETTTIHDFFMSKISFDKTCTVEERDQELSLGPEICFERETADQDKQFGNFTMDTGALFDPNGMGAMMRPGLPAGFTMPPVH